MTGRSVLTATSADGPASGSPKLGPIPHVKAELQVADSQIQWDQAQPVPVSAGGLLIFHSLVLHMSKRNESAKPRWAIIGDYDPSPNPAIDNFRTEGNGGSGLAGIRQDGSWPLRQPQAVGAK